MGRGSSGAGGGGGLTYDRLPFAAVFNPKYASKEELATKREIVSRFMSEADVGNVYLSSAGVGSSGSEFEIVSYRRSPNGKGIRSGRRTVALTSANIVEYIKNGARLVHRGR